MSKTALLKAVWEQSRGLLILVCVLVLLSVGLFVYQNRFIDPETNKLRQRQQGLQKQLKEREANFAQSGVPVSALEQMEKDLARLAEMIPAKQQFADFVGDLFTWAEQADLGIREITYRPKSDDKSSYLVYSLNFSVKGTYDQVKKFIHLLENSRRILVIDKISMSGDINQNYSPVVSLQINLSTYFQEDAK